MNRLETHRWLDSIDLVGLREDCDISRTTVASAFEVSRWTVWTWETHKQKPIRKLPGFARFVRGLLNHIEAYDE